MKILNLTIKKKWFDMILSGEKPEEYREIKQYWVNRLYGPVEKNHIENCFENHGGCIHFEDLDLLKFDAVKFTNGYSKTSPSFLIECLEIEINEGLKKWGAESKTKYFVIKLGKII